MSDIDFDSLKEQWKVVDRFYRVHEFVTTFKKDPGKNDSFHHDEDFKNKNLLKSREAATQYYHKRLEGFEDGSYFLPFTGPDDFIDGENAAFTISLSLVELLANGEEQEYILLPDNHEEEETMNESRDYEKYVINEFL